MIQSAELGSIIGINSLQEWDSTFREIAKSRICGLGLETTGEDPLSDEIKLVSISLPNCVYTANASEQGKKIVCDIAGLLEQKNIKKVIYDAKPLLAFIRGSVDRKVNVCNIFDLMLASQICWSGYHYLTPSNSIKNPWKKNNPNHSLASLSERHLGIILADEGSFGRQAALLLPLHDILAELITRNDLQRIADFEFDPRAV